MAKVWGYGTGNGPWIMADLENCRRAARLFRRNG